MPFYSQSDDRLKREAGRTWRSKSMKTAFLGLLLPEWAQEHHSGEPPVMLPRLFGAPPISISTIRVPRVRASSGLGCCCVNQVQAKGAVSLGGGWVREWLNWYKIPNYQKGDPRVLWAYVRPVLLKMKLTSILTGASPTPLAGIWVAEAPGTEQRLPPSFTAARPFLVCSTPLPWPGADSLHGVQQGLLRRVVVKPVASWCHERLCPDGHRQASAQRWFSLPPRHFLESPSTASSPPCPHSRAARRGGELPSSSCSSSYGNANAGASRAGWRERNSPGPRWAASGSPAGRESPRPTPRATLGTQLQRLPNKSRVPNGINVEVGAVKDIHSRQPRCCSTGKWWCLGVACGQWHLHCVG